MPFATPAARRLFGRPDGVELTVAELRAPRLADAIEEARASRVAVEVEFSLQRASATHLCAQVVPLTEEARFGLGADAERPDLLVAVEDRTRARRSEELHRDFVANASHELKTPLAALSGLIETLLGHGRDDPEALARFLPMMATQTERMRRLVEDLLSLNRIELNERRRPQEPVDILSVLREAVEALRPMAEAEGARLVVPAIETTERVLVPAAREEIAQVFANLIENAIKYGGRGNEVRVERLDGVAGRAGMIGFGVEDDGPGIAREHLPRLTERFYRVSVPRSRERGGTGLGLAIVKHVLNRHRASLEIESRVGHGSRFTVWLPLMAEAGSAAGAKAARSGRRQPAT
ncbi:MAG: ATP-binding protein [Paracoccaceae bacterium]